jgi:hypothetical protein
VSETQEIEVPVEYGTRISQPVDEVRSLGGGGDLHGAVAAGLAAAGEENGNGRQVRQDLIFTHISVRREPDGFAAAPAAPGALRLKRLCGQVACAVT